MYLVFGMRLVMGMWVYVRGFHAGRGFECSLENNFHPPYGGTRIINHNSNHGSGYFLSTILSRTGEQEWE